MPHLLILSRQAQDYANLLTTADLPDLKIVTATDSTTAIEQGSNCDIVFGEPNLIAQTITHLPALRWVQATWAGVEPLLDPNLRRNYTLTNARGVFGELMSEYVFSYLLAYERRLLQRYASQQLGHWDKTPPGQLKGKCLGLLGVGSIGSEIARTAKHFGLRVKGYTRSSESSPAVDAYYHGHQLLEFVEGLDYLVSVLPNTADTRQIVDAQLLNALPRGAVFVNVGRGSAVVEADLIAALASGHLANAVLDVFVEEPLPSTHPFWRTPNLLITSHTSALTIPADMVKVFIENYRRYRHGEELLYRVDFAQGY
jgi:phosphoglycerate dehydrogenase-like enzyme